MTDPHELERLLHETVDGLEPADRLHAIHARTSRTPDSRVDTGPRRWLVAVAGAAVAVAAVVAGAAALSGNDRPDEPDRPPVADNPPDPVRADGSATTGAADPSQGKLSTAPSKGEPMAETTVPVYYVLDTEKAGPRLVREFTAVQGDPFEAALARLTSGQPRDDAYRTLWPAGSFGAVSYHDAGTHGVIQVEVRDDGWNTPAPGMSERQAEQAIQQVVYTLQGVAQTRAEVRFVAPDGSPWPVLLGVDVSDGVTNASPLQTLNLVSITSPEQGAVVSGQRLKVTGVASSNEANVVCTLLAGGTEVVTRPFTAEGWMGDRLFPFEGHLPLAGARPGELVVRCSTDDPSGGSEGFGAFTDDKLVTLR